MLTIGIAVDANVLIFERIKEELKRGLPKSSAIEEGFRRAWPSIRDSNTSTIITAIILYFFTSSFVQGFALTLLIGTLVSLFSAITTTRLFLRFFLKDDKVKQLTMLNIVGHKKIWFTLSIILVGIACCNRELWVSGKCRVEGRHVMGIHGSGK